MCIRDRNKLIFIIQIIMNTCNWVIMMFISYNLKLCANLTRMDQALVEIRSGRLWTKLQNLMLQKLLISSSFNCRNGQRGQGTRYNTNTFNLNYYTLKLTGFWKYCQLINKKFEPSCRMTSLAREGCVHLGCSVYERWLPFTSIFCCKHQLLFGLLPQI